jgi:hypothetical protein
MAKELKADTVETVRLTKEIARDAIKMINGPKEKAREHNGVAASATKTFCDDHGLNKQAVTAVAGLHRKEQDQQSEYLRSLLTMAWKTGLFYGPDDAFDDHPVEIMRQIVAERDEIRARGEGRKSGVEAPAEMAAAVH